MPPLREGNQGPAVKRLQRLLNSRLEPSPELAVDGEFGPLTHRALLNYQTGARINVDGIAGKETWFVLLKGERARAPRPVAGIPGVEPTAPGPTGPGPTAPGPTAPGLSATSGPLAAKGVLEWTLEEKFTSVLHRTAPKLPGSMRQEFEALLTPEAVTAMVATLVVWAAAHSFGVGQVVDVLLLVAGLVFLGLAVFDVAAELSDFLYRTSTAESEDDLEDAAGHLSRAIAVIGVAGFVALLAKVAKGGSGKSGKQSGAPAAGEVATKSEKAPPPAPQSRLQATERQLDELYARAPAAKKEIDEIAKSIADRTGGTVARADLKGRERALEKALEPPYNGDASQIKDIARNTIVVERSEYDNAVRMLKEQGIPVKNVEAASDPLGYSGAKSVVQTKAGIPAEIQVNTPEMIYAKEPAANAKAILGEQRYAEIAEKAGVPGGQGHAMYEQYRTLPAGDPRAKAIEAQSRAYYDQIRRIGE